MSLPVSPEDIKKLKAFVEFCSANVAVLNLPQLSFVKEFVEKLGGKVPEGEFKLPGGCPFGGGAAKTEQPPKQQETPKDAPADVDMDSESDSESELELDMDGVIESDNDPSQPMGDETKTPTEEEIDQSSELRGQAAAAFSEKEYQESIDLYTKAIELNPGNALFHAKRGQAFLSLNKPNACIRDCDRALELNCDSAAAYKFRGRAHRLLGNWEAAANDLRQACKLDYDEIADEWLREVTPNAKKIEQHRIKQERKRAEKELKKRQERVRRTQEANEKARDENKKKPTAGADFGQKVNFQDVLSALNDPEIAAALADITGNPANIEKYKNNPKIAKLLEVVKGMGGAGGGGGGVPGFPGFPGFPGGFPGAGANVPPPTDVPPTEPKPATQKPDFVDDGLD